MTSRSECTSRVSETRRRPARVTPEQRAEMETAAALARAGANTVFVIRRWKLRGGHSTIHVEALPDRMIVHRGSHPRHIRSRDLLALVRSTPDLKQVRPEEMTEIFVAPSEIPNLARLAEVLELIDPGNAADRLPLRWPAEIDERIDSESVSGVGTRPLFLNGQRWAWLEQEGHAPGPLVPTENDDGVLRPARGKLLAEWSDLCTASMTSGSIGATLFECTDTIAIAELDLDESGKSYLDFAYDRNDLVTLIADFLFQTFEELNGPREAVFLWAKKGKPASFSGDDFEDESLRDFETDIDLRLPKRDIPRLVELLRSAWSPKEPTAVPEEEPQPPPTRSS